MIFDMAGYAFEPVVSVYHQVEVDQIQTPPSIGLLHDRVGSRDWGWWVCVCVARAWTLPSNRSAYLYSLHIHFVHFKEIA